MPLHLLGKKSWNVYNADNIAKVRRDEAAAKAQDEDEERRMQEADAERRIQILRGLQSAPSKDVVVHDERDEEGILRSGAKGRERKRRKLAGEDDTDHAIRLAKQQQRSTSSAEGKQVVRLSNGSNVPIIDRSGHINLFPEPSSRQYIAKNTEAEAEAAKKKREFEDQFTMRFSNAAGFKQDIGAEPWYSSLAPKATERGEGETSNTGAGVEVWGNENPERREREKKRIEASDPLAAIKRGVRDLRKVETERKAWQEEREMEARELKTLAERERRRRKRENKDDADSYSLQGFSLDGVAIKSPARERSKRSPERSSSSRRHRRHHRHRDRTRSRENPHRDLPKNNPRDALDDGHEGTRERNSGDRAYQPPAKDRSSPVESERHGGRKEKMSQVLAS